MKVAPEILSLVPYAPGKPISETKRELGLTDVVKLASNECPLPPSDSVVKALHDAILEINRYPDGASFEMKRAVSDYYGIAENQLAFGNGSNELIDLLIRIYCRPGEAISTSQTAFIAYKISAQAACVRTVEVPLGPDYRFDLNGLAKALNSDPRIRLVFLPNPNNPTGTYFTVAELDQFMESVQSRDDVLIVLDEAYVEFVRAKDFPDGLSYFKKFSNVALLRTMSKVFGLAGLRVGTLIARPETIDLVHRVRNPFNVNSLAQAAVVAALKDRKRLEEICELTWEGVDYFQAELKRLGLPFCPSQANFVFFDGIEDSQIVFTKLLKEGLILRPLKNYMLPTHLRMSVGRPTENKRAIQALEKVLRGNR